MQPVKSVTMNERQLEEAAMEGLWIFECPYCSCDVEAEPDADMVYCGECDKKVEIVNPYF